MGKLRGKAAIMAKGTVRLKKVSGGSVAGYLGAIEKLAQTRDPKERTAIRLRLTRLSNVAPAALVHGLDSAKGFARWHLINLLGRIADPATLKRVLQFALEEHELHARWRAYWAFTRFPRERSIPLLLGVLRSGSAERKWRAALILSIMGRQEAAPVILRGTRSKDSWTLFEALSAIRALRIPGAEKILARFLGPKTALNLRQQAVLALGTVSSKRAAALLCKALSDPHPQVRWRAAMSLGHTGRYPQVPLLRGTLQKEKDPHVRSHLRAALKRMEASHAKTARA